jgi:hypothetical protein
MKENAGGAIDKARATASDHKSISLLLNASSTTFVDRRCGLDKVTKFWFREVEDVK